MSQSPILELATVEEILEELSKRFPNVIIIGMRDLPGDSRYDQFLVLDHGSITTSIGLCGRAYDHLCRLAFKERSSDGGR